MSSVTTHGPQPSAAPRPEQRRDQQQSTQAQPQPGLVRQAAPRPDVQVQLRSAPAKAEPKHSTPTYEEIAAHLEPLIAREVEQIAQQLADKKLTPADVAMVYGVDITGLEISVCLACGIVGHDYQPSMMRTQNPAIDMMSESLVVFMEAASRAGIRYGIFAYDDDGRLIIRAPSEANTGRERANAIARFEGFRDRFSNVTLSSGLVVQGKVSDQAWLRAQGARWQPADATRRVAGCANDELAKTTLIELFNGVPQCQVRSALLMKSLPPAASLLGVEAALKSHRIGVAGLAVGAQAAEVRRNFFRLTTIAKSMRDIHTVQNQAIRNSLETVVS